MNPLSQNRRKQQKTKRDPGIMRGFRVPRYLDDMLQALRQRQERKFTPIFIDALAVGLTFLTIEQLLRDSAEMNGRIYLSVADFTAAMSAAPAADGKPARASKASYVLPELPTLDAAVREAASDMISLWLRTADPERFMAWIRELQVYAWPHQLGIPSQPALFSDEAVEDAAR